jgi:hypothetical protein
MCPNSSSICQQWASGQTIAGCSVAANASEELVAVSLQPEPIGFVPEQTARVAHAAFPAGNPYLRMRDEMESLVEDRELAHLFPRRGQPAERPWRLALITMLQFVEDLSERQAADASVLGSIGSTRSAWTSTIQDSITQC